VDCIHLGQDKVQWLGLVNILKDGEFLDKLSDNYLLKKESVSWNLVS
jgi:hypothetical protein